MQQFANTTAYNTSVNFFSILYYFIKNSDPIGRLSEKNIKLRLLSFRFNFSVEWCDFSLKFKTPGKKEKVLKFITIDNFKKDMSERSL